MRTVTPSIIEGMHEVLLEFAGYTRPCHGMQPKVKGCSALTAQYI